MTKDLAGCIHGLRNVKDGMYLYTQVMTMGGASRDIHDISN